MSEDVKNSVVEPGATGGTVPFVDGVFIAPRGITPIEIESKNIFAVAAVLCGSKSEFIDILVLGSSLKRRGKNYDTVLFLLSDYTTDQINLLSLFWDILIRVDLSDVCGGSDAAINRSTVEGTLSAAPCPEKSKVYRELIPAAKFNAYRLLSYHKVLVLDGDMHVNSPIADLFQEAIPAASFRLRQYAWNHGLTIPNNLYLSDEGNVQLIANFGAVLIRPLMSSFELLVKQVVAAVGEETFSYRDIWQALHQAEWKSLSSEYNYRTSFVMYGPGKAFGQDPALMTPHITHFHGRSKASDIFFFFDDYKVFRPYFNKTRNRLVENMVSWDVLPDLKDAEDSDEIFWSLYKEWIKSFTDVGQKVVAKLGPVLFKSFRPEKRIDIEAYRLELESESKERQLRRGSEPFMLNRGGRPSGTKIETSHGASIIRLPNRP